MEVNMKLSEIKFMAKMLNFITGGSLPLRMILNMIKNGFELEEKDDKFYIRTKFSIEGWKWIYGHSE